MRFSVNTVKNEILGDLNKKLLISPALAPYIISQIAGKANIKVAVPGILSGSVAGFKPRTGRTKERGLMAIFKNQKTGFQASLWTPLFNIFAGNGKRKLPLWASFDITFTASGIAESVISDALNNFDENRIPDLDRYLSLGIRRRR